jgi:hypothetical protein
MRGRVPEFLTDVSLSLPVLPQNRHPAAAACEAKWRGLLFLLCPSNLTAANKSHRPPLVIPSAAEGPAVRPGSRTKVSVPFVLPQTRHLERSASPINRPAQRLWRGVEEPVLSVAEGTSAVLIFPMLC